MATEREPETATAAVIARVFAIKPGRLRAIIADLGLQPVGQERRLHGRPAGVYDLRQVRQLLEERGRRADVVEGWTAP